MFRPVAVILFLCSVLLIPLHSDLACAADETETAESLSAKISALRLVGELEAALDLAQRMLKLQEDSPETPAWELQNTDLLISQLEFMLDQKPDLRRQLVLADSLQGVAEAAMDAGDLDGMESAITQQLEIRQHLLDENHGRDLIESLAWKAYCRQFRGDFSGAIEFFQQALDLSRIVLGPDNPDVAVNLLNLGYVLNGQGLWEDAARCSREALRMCRRLYGTENSNTAWALNNLGTDYHMMGDYLSAEPLYREALAIKRKLSGDQDPEIGGLLNNLGEIHMHQGNFADAETDLRESLRVYALTHGEIHPEIAKTLDNLASALQKQGKSSDAEELYRQALAMKSAIYGERHPEIAVALMNYGNLLMETGRLAEADSQYLAALDMQRTLLGEDHPKIAMVLSARANIQSRLGHPDAAVALYRQAIEMNERLAIGPHPDTVQYLHNLGRAYRQQGAVEAAEECFARATTMFEQVRLRAGHGLDRSTFLSAPHLALAAARLALGHSTEAWDPIGQVRGRFLTEQLLAGDSNRLTTAELSTRDSLIAELADAEREFESLHQEESAEQNDRLAELQVLIPRIEASLGSFQKRMADRYPATEGRTYEPDEVQNTLSDHEAIIGWLDVQVGKNRIESWGYVIRNRGDIAWYPLADGLATDPYDLSQQFAKSVRTVDLLGDWSTEHAQALYRNRITPLLGSLRGVQDLTIIPSGPMLGVPVEALVNDSGRFLADRFSVHYVPSWNIHTWLAEQDNGRKKSTKSAMLLVGDPPFRPEHLTAMQARGESASIDLAARPTRNLAVFRSALSGDKQAVASLPRLAGSRWEIEQIVAGRSNARTLLGPEATEQALIGLARSGELARYRTIHLATHALVNDQRPERSALILSQIDLPDPVAAAAAGERIYDGLLTCREIAGELKMNADLVVLSACETGLGRQVGEEGYIGFSSAFMLAGARSVLVSLWPVEDEATALLMRKFYEIRDNKRSVSNAQALRQAKAWLRSYSDELGAQPFRHPFYWSSFILIGDPR